MSKLVRPDLKFREDRGSSLCPMIIVDRTISGPDSPLWAHSGRKLCAAPQALRGPNQSRGCASGGGLRNGSQRAHRVASPCLSDPSPLQGPALTHGFRSRTRTDGWERSGPSRGTVSPSGDRWMGWSRKASARQAMPVRAPPAAAASSWGTSERPPRCIDQPSMGRPVYGTDPMVLEARGKPIASGRASTQRIAMAQNAPGPRRP